VGFGYKSIFEVTITFDYVERMKIDFIKKYKNTSFLNEVFSYILY